MKDFSFSVFPNENYVDLRLYQFGCEQCEPLHSFGPFIRNHYLFHYVLSGRGQLLSADEEGDTRTFSLEAGQGFLICPGLVNTYSADERSPWKYMWLEFDGLRAKDLLTNAGLTSRDPIYLAGDPEADSALRGAMGYIVENPDAPPVRLIGQLYLFLDALILASASRKNSPRTELRDFYIQEAVTYMEQNLSRNVTVEEIADVCGLNRSYFSKLFRESMGCPPQEFLIRMRLARATELMRAGEMSIGEVAARCGYPNQLHFSRAFKKRYGVPPREWRSQNGAPPKKSQR